MAPPAMSHRKVKAESSPIEDPKLDDTDVDEPKTPKTPKGDGNKKPSKAVELTPVESLLFMNLVRFNPCPERIDWEKVAQHSNLKNPASAKVRFRQILKKHGVEDFSPNASRGQSLKRKTANEEDDEEGDQPEVVTPTAPPKKSSVPRKKTAGGSDRGKKGKKASKEPGDAAASQNGQKRHVKAEEGAEAFSGDGAAGLSSAAQFAAPPRQAQRQTPSANSVGSPPMFAAPVPQQQQQQQQQQRQLTPLPLQGNNAGFSPSHVYYCPDEIPGLISILGGATSGRLLHVNPSQYQNIQQICAQKDWRMIPFPDLSANVGFLRQMGNAGGMAAGMAGDPSGQPAQVNQPFAANHQPADPRGASDNDGDNNDVVTKQEDSEDGLVGQGDDDDDYEV